VGKVISAENSLPVSKVHVWSNSYRKPLVTDENGEFLIKVKSKRKINLIASHISYEKYEQWVSVKSKDTLFLTIKMLPKVYELKAAEAYSERAPEQMFHSSFHYVHDFEIDNERLVLITFSQSLKKDPKLTLCDLNEQILDEISLDKEPVKLYRDFAGRIFIEYESQVQLIDLEGDSIMNLIDVNAHEYAKSVKPCRDSVNNQILFSDQVWFLPRFNYLAFDIRDSLFFMLRHITNPQVEHMLRWEYYDMTVDAQLQAMKIADHFPDMDKQEIGGLMSGFQNSIYCEEPYAPIFVTNDTIMIFDHYSDYIFRYSNSLETIDSIEISYHKPQKRRTWKRQVYKDAKSDLFYGLYLQNGYSYLKLIDTKNGGVKATTKLQNQFVKKIKVHNDYAYYIYKPMSSPIKPFIFRELLTDAQ